MYFPKNQPNTSIKYELGNQYHIVNNTGLSTSGIAAIHARLTDVDGRGHETVLVLGLIVDVHLQVDLLQGRTLARRPT